jgi:hypothetical protein
LAPVRIATGTESESVVARARFGTFRHRVRLARIYGLRVPATFSTIVSVSSGMASRTRRSASAKVASPATAAGWRRSPRLRSASWWLPLS